MKVASARRDSVFCVDVNNTLYCGFFFLEEKRLCYKKKIFKKSYCLHFWYPQNKYVQTVETFMY